jgi:hypothetical protein
MISKNRRRIAILNKNRDNLPDISQGNITIVMTQTVRKKEKYVLV